MSKHINNGACLKCDTFFLAYPDFNRDLYYWFKDVQYMNPEAHISCAGRGKAAQEAAFNAGTSKAHFGQSSHNYNMAIDVFELRDGVAVWDKAWFNKVIAPRVTDKFCWYGSPGSIFYELPHIEIKNWKFDKTKKLVEPLELVG